MKAKRWERRLEALELAVTDLGIGSDVCPTCFPPVSMLVFKRELDEALPTCPACGEVVDHDGHRVTGQVIVLDLGSGRRAQRAREIQDAGEGASA